MAFSIVTTFLPLLPHVHLFPQPRRFSKHRGDEDLAHLTWWESYSQRKKKELFLGWLRGLWCHTDGHSLP